jgi:hypothetical protein
VKRLAVLGILLLAGCGSHGRSAADVARAWSSAIDRGDNQAAARLFADRARVVQGGELVLKRHADAVRWNASLPCGGRITSVTDRGHGEVLVVFTLTERPHHACDAPGTSAAALFQVQHGRIVLWHQTEVPETDTTPVV